MAGYEKINGRLGFLFNAYTQRCWWFEAVQTIYKLTMMVFVEFVSDFTTNKILVSMLVGACLIALVAFYQPFKDHDILSINSMVQLETLFVLFAAQFLQLNPDANHAQVGLVLVCLSLAPIVAAVKLVTKRMSIRKMMKSTVSIWDSLVTKVPGSARRRRNKQDAVADDGAVDSNGWHSGVPEPGVEFGVNPMHTNQDFKTAVGAIARNMHLSQPVEQDLQGADEQELQT